MKITESQIVKVTKRAEVGIMCDVCGKIDNNPNTDLFYSLSHQHNEWGNDSVDSYERFDVCSFDCYMKQLKKSLKEMDRYSRSAMIDDKPFLFVKQMVKDYFKT